MRDFAAAATGCPVFDWVLLFFCSAFMVVYTPNALLEETSSAGVMNSVNFAIIDVPLS